MPVKLNLTHNRDEHVVPTPVGATKNRDDVESATAPPTTKRKKKKHTRAGGCTAKLKKVSS